MINKFSSITIAKNEEQNIARCVESMLNCIDDILIFIDDSTDDKTVEIIKKYPNVRYELVRWQGYGKTKQIALEKTKYDWVFWIDSDEAISNELQNEINDLKKNELKYVAFKMNRRANFLGKWIKHSGWYPGEVERLFNKKFCHFNESLVHEGLEINGEIGKLKKDLLHYTYYNIEQYYHKFNIYTSLHSKEMLEKNKKVGLIDLLIRPFALFVKMYLIKLGFLDGLHGFILAFLSANYVFTKYAKLWELKNNKGNL